jgi:isopropylmalate/homocitrate/citramalate synthase
MANALAGLEAGAEVFDTSVNGCGERAGQLNIGTFALVCEAFFGERTTTGMRLANLASVSQLVQRLSHTEQLPYSPLSGADAFCMTVEPIRRVQHYVDRYVNRPIAPELVGAEQSHSLGIHSGPVALGQEAARLGIEVSEEELVFAAGRFSIWLQEHRRRISDEELTQNLTLQASRNVARGNRSSGGS